MPQQISGSSPSAAAFAMASGLAMGEATAATTSNDIVIKEKRILSDLARSGWNR